MKIAVASGKGGTGKTTVSSNLALCLSKKFRTALVDCDVEEPNIHIFFNGPAESKKVFQKKPFANPELCSFCKECMNFCKFGAINIIKENIYFSYDLCHSCGGCKIICPENAIFEEDIEIGEVSVYSPDNNLTVIEGRLLPGKPSGNDVIDTAKQLSENFDIVIYDSPPGSACPFIETVHDSDFCVLVTESTPFGLHDLKAAFEVCKKLNVPVGVIINRSLEDDSLIENFCKEECLDILMKIPNSLEIARIQNNGELFVRVMPKWETDFLNLFESIKSRGFD
ncbi:P-loop NTPase [Methanoplanus sp. FWC-SCC4]|uniref:P-loop NTPase n=1 Tax=Methanochimaera problematica TaxID=2609417 RepID=A0AA97I2Z9_9EURY|nr:ATP-binding protein [Methanoplanus sp. FWC-SCC4]WOF16138.1 P-loop NTPase [Methanoplanus sp. FWC-SCC4]